ncbi:MAG: acyl-CoA dehydrogenase family protein [candidate division WOR-3 bacterium]|nr:MAG: acyl-CoA dehydrogenase family protein [candidate division WOR-3 bacterium]
MSIVKMNSEQKLIRNEVKKFASVELDPISSDIEREGRVPEAILGKTAQMGLFGLTVPEKYGGSGLDGVSLCVALEELGRSCSSLALVVAVNNCLIAQPILKFGSASMQEDYLRRLGKGMIGGYVPFSEIETQGKGFTLDERGDGRQISGKCDVVLNGALAGFIVVPVKENDVRSLYLVDKGQAGMVVHPTAMMGLRASGAVGMGCQGTPVIRDNRLNPEAVEYSLEFARIGYSAVALGLIRASLDCALKYSKERKQFGRAICEFPMVREMLADIKLCEERSRLAVYDAASRFDEDEDFKMAARVACLTSCDGAVASTLKAIQVHGGYGYIQDYPVERYFRDAKSLQLLGEVPVNIKSRIAQEILL